MRAQIVKGGGQDELKRAEASIPEDRSKKSKAAKNPTSPRSFHSWKYKKKGSDRERGSRGVRLTYWRAEGRGGAKNCGGVEGWKSGRAEKKHAKLGSWGKRGRPRTKTVVISKELRWESVLEKGLLSCENLLEKNHHKRGKIEEGSPNHSC